MRLFSVMINSNMILSLKIEDKRTKSWKRAQKPFGQFALLRTQFMIFLCFIFHRKNVNELKRVDDDRELLADGHSNIFPSNAFHDERKTGGDVNEFPVHSNLHVLNNPLVHLH